MSNKGQYSYVELGVAYRRCLLIAKSCWHGVADPSPAELHASATTLFIESNRQGLRPSEADINIFIGMAQSIAKDGEG
jgi:hypothetical protein